MNFLMEVQMMNKTEPRKGFFYICKKIGERPEKAKSLPFIGHLFTFE